MRLYIDKPFEQVELELYAAFNSLYELPIDCYNLSYDNKEEKVQFEFSTTCTIPAVLQNKMIAKVIEVAKS
jgi:hypothetical protein